MLYEVITNLHVLRDEEFYDTMEELVNIDYLPLIDDPKQMERDRQRSILRERTRMNTLYKVCLAICSYNFV